MTSINTSQLTFRLSGKRTVVFSETCPVSLIFDAATDVFVASMSKHLPVYSLQQLSVCPVK